MWSGDQPVQLQGLTLCGSVTAGRQIWIFLKFLHISDLHRSPVDKATITDMDFVFPVPALPFLT